MRLFNKLYGLLPLSLLLSLVACTSETGEQPVKPTPEPSGGSARREVMLTLKNKLSVAATKAVTASATPGATAAAPSTKAEPPIATAGENKIESLDIYVFGSATEDGEYTYQERLCYRAKSSDIPSGDDVTAFELNASGATAKEATALLTIRKGLFVKLYCLANQSKLTGEDGQPAVTFRPLVQSAPGQMDNLVTEGSPTEEEFLQYRSPLLSATAEADTLTPPLPMTGAYTTPLDLTDFSVSARLQMGFRLTRAVARFDVVNDAETSRFTIQSVSLAKGRRGVSFFPLKVFGSVPAGGNELITYPVRTFWGENANKGICTGAFYTYPSPSEDEAYLVLNGIYAANKTDKVPVTYQVPFKPVGEGNYIEVTQNHRYTVNITDADEYHLDFTLDVADWNDEGSIDDYTPGGEGETTALKVDVGVGGDNTYDEASRTVTMAITAGSQFTITGGSTSGYLTRLYYKDNDTEHQWLTMTPPADYMPATKADAGPTTYTIARKEGYTGNSFPLAFIRFTDKTTLQETVVIVQPIADPVLTQKAISAGSTFDLDNKLITLYKKADVPSPSVTFTALVSGGNILKFTDADTPGNWLQVTPSEMQSDAAQMEYIMAPNTSAADFPNPFPVEGKAFTITNKGDDTKKTTMTLKLKSDLIVTPEKEGNAGFENDKLTLYDHAEDKVKLTVNTICGSDITDISTWLTVAKENENKNTTTYIFSVAENGYVGTGGSFVIRSKADNTISKRYSVESKSTAVTVTANSVSSGSTFSGNVLTLNQTTYGTNPTATLEVLASGGSRLENVPDWLTVSSKESASSTGTYIFTANTSHTGFPNPFLTDGYTFDVINKGNESKKQTITVKMKSNVTATVGAPTSATSSALSFYDQSNKKIHLFDDASSVQLTVFSLGGCSVSSSPSWVSVTSPSNNNSMQFSFKMNGTASEDATGNIVFTNSAGYTLSIPVYARKKDLRLSNFEGSNSYTYVTAGSSITADRPNITYYPTRKNYFTFIVRSPFGVTALDNTQWINYPSITATTTQPNGDKIQTIKVTQWTGITASTCNTRRKTGTITLTGTTTGSLKYIDLKTEHLTCNNSDITEPPVDVHTSYDRYWMSQSLGWVNASEYDTYKNKCPEGWTLISAPDITYLFIGTRISHNGSSQIIDYNQADKNYATNILNGAYVAISGGAGWFFCPSESATAFSLGVAQGANGIQVRCWRKYSSSDN